MRALLSLAVFAAFPAFSVIVTGPRACVALMNVAREAAAAHGTSRNEAVEALHQFMVREREGPALIGTPEADPALGIVAFSDNNSDLEWPVIETRIKQLLRDEHHARDNADIMNENHVQLIRLKGRSVIESFLEPLRAQTRENINDEWNRYVIGSYYWAKLKAWAFGLSTTIYGSYLAIGNPEMTNWHWMGGAALAFFTFSNVMQSRNLSPGLQMISQGSPLRIFLNQAHHHTWTTLHSDIFISKAFLRKIMERAATNTELTEEEARQFSRRAIAFARHELGNEADFVLFRFDLLYRHSEEPELVVGLRSYQEMDPLNPPRPPRPPRRGRRETDEEGIPAGGLVTVPVPAR